VTIDERDLFERLEPPPGGRQALRERLSREPGRRRRRAAAITFSAAAAAIATVLLLWLGRGDDRRTTAAHRPATTPDLIQRSHAHPALAGINEPMWDEPVSVATDKRDRYAVRRVATKSTQVVFYMVAAEHRAKPRPEKLQ